jgi:dTDP-4-dehydrorhamnose reductase
MVDLLITGTHGQLGRALQRIAPGRGLQVVGHDIDTLDICDPAAVEEMVHALRPTTVVNCAAMTAVDACETDPGSALQINGDAVGHLASACNMAAARLVQISTDYVFAGDGHQPYTEADPPAPISAYGRSKLRGEKLAASAHEHLIVRTAWLYGRGGRNFVETIRGQLQSGANQLRVVADQVGSPTFCDDLADALLDLEQIAATGIVHCVNSGTTSWHGFAVEIVRLSGADAEVQPVTTAEYPRPAPRPTNSALDTARLTSLTGRPMPQWRDALARYLEGPCAS